MTDSDGGPSVDVGRPAWARREFPSVFSVEETARRAGHYKWLEMRMFEIMGGWVALAPELEVKAMMGTHCYHHAFHAELWHKRLPELRETNPERLTTSANVELEVFLDALALGMDTESTVEKLTGMYRVLLPAQIAAYTYHLNNTSTITDAPTMRTLELCLNDDLAEWREGEMLLQSFLQTEAAIERSAAHQTKLMKLFLAAKGIAGPGSVG